MKVLITILIGLWVVGCGKSDEVKRLEEENQKLKAKLEEAAPSKPQDHGNKQKPQASENQETPADLLRNIYSLIQKDDYEKLKDCYFQWPDGSYTPYGSRSTGWDKFVEYIKKAKELEKENASVRTGFQPKPLKNLIDNYLDKLMPPPDAALKGYMSDGEFGKIDKRIVEIAKNRPQDITVFHYKRVEIHIIKIGGHHKILMWDGDLHGLE